MNNTEAKFILSAYRPSGMDADDPQIAEAIAQMRQDPVLEEWFKTELEFDAAFARQVQSIPVPETLRNNILAGSKVSTPKPVRKNPWLPGNWLAIAATFVVLAGIAGIWLRQNRSESLSGWQTGALKTIASMQAGHEQFDAASPDAAKLQAWLQAKNAPLPGTLPASLQSLASLGCKTLTWKDRTVSIICFNLGNDKAIHLVVVDRNGLPEAPPDGRPRFVRNGDWITASWSEGGKSMMLATKGDRKEIDRFL